MLKRALHLLFLFPALLPGESIGFNSHIRPLLSDHCFACHGFDSAAREADLRLDTPEGAFAKRDNRAGIVPGDPKDSLIWQRIISDDPDEVMPPPDHLLRLDKEEKSLLRRWIEEGAKYEKHWTFIPVEKPTLPDLAPHPVDALVFEKLKSLDLKPSARARKETLVRRLSFDLRGLPPTPAEVETFLADASPEAWETLVDQFLADPAFGERFAWPWLDAARYADSNGFQNDAERTMWPWRDWVVDAINRNLPYDDFTVWQIAGDLLPNATPEQILATGFLRNHAINGEGGSIPEENRVNYVFDMAETVGTVWMGLTFNCCRCHDHKYDPLSQKDYYSLTAFFNQTPVTGAGGNPQTKPNLAVPQPGDLEKRKSLQTGIQQLKEKRDTLEKNDPGLATLDKELKTLEQKSRNLEKGIPRVMVMADQAERRKTFVLAIGSYQSPGEEVTAATPGILPPLSEPDSPDRLDLARWLVSPDHPLTSRVTVNRLWQDLFGLGLIKSPEDLGVQSEIPVYPELLDWLAADFMDSGWDFKKLVKTIVTSEVYRQSSRVDSFALERDPNNRLLARAPRYRLPSWMIRDQALAHSGRLIRTPGGEPVKPWQPEGLWSEVTFGKGKKHYVPDTGEKLRRRSLYTFWRRISAPPMIFDNAKRENCEVGVYRTNSPLHALATLNDPLYLESARALAYRAHSLDPKDPLGTAFRVITARQATPAESKTIATLYQNSLVHFQKSPEETRDLLAAGELPLSNKIAPPVQAALTTTILSLLNTDEALTRE